MKIANPGQRHSQAKNASFLMPAVNLAVAATLGLGLWAFSAAGPASAQSASCQNDFAALNKKLEGQVAALNALSGAGGKKKQLDPATACPRLRNLSATERELLAYMKKEQSWCGIPDELIQKFSERAANTSRIAGQACKAAVQMKQMQRQQAAGPAPDQRPRLPSGPL